MFFQVGWNQKVALAVDVRRSRLVVLCIRVSSVAGVWCQRASRWTVTCSACGRQGMCFIIGNLKGAPPPVPPPPKDLAGILRFPWFCVNRTDTRCIPIWILCTWLFSIACQLIFLFGYFIGDHRACTVQKQHLFPKNTFAMPCPAFNGAISCRKCCFVFVYSQRCPFLPNRWMAGV